MAELLTAPLPGDGPVGEAWVLSDRDDHPSKFANGPLKGRTLAQLLELWRLSGQSPFAVGAAGVTRVRVCIEGKGQVEHSGATYAVGKGDVWLLPAVVGACVFRPSSAVTLLEIAPPETEVEE